MENAVFTKVLTAARSLSLPHLCVVGDGKKISLSAKYAIPGKGATRDDFSVVVGDTNNTFVFIFDVDAMRLMKGDYLVEISSEGISHFAHQSRNLEYWVAVSDKSEYDTKQ